MLPSDPARDDWVAHDGPVVGPTLGRWWGGWIGGDSGYILLGGELMGGHIVRGVLPMALVHAKWGRGMTVRDAMAGTILVAIDRQSVQNAMGRTICT